MTMSSGVTSLTCQPKHTVIIAASTPNGHKRLAPKGWGMSNRGPLQAVKLAAVSFREVDPFRPLGRRGTPYSAEATATCAMDHAGPSPSCRCGFHAMQDIPALLAAAALTPAEFSRHAILEVELGGRVVHHERGYRGQQQRILRASFLEVCHSCISDAMMITPADALCLLDHDGATIVVPVCADHADRPIAPPDVGGVIGTEVAWSAFDQSCAWLELCKPWMGVP